MVLTSAEKRVGYELQWRDRNSRTLTKNGIVVGMVENQNQLAFEIEAHERYLDVIDRNKDEREDSDLMTIGQAIVISVFIITLMSMVLMYIYYSR